MDGQYVLLAFVLVSITIMLFAVVMGKMNREHDEVMWEEFQKREAKRSKREEKEDSAEPLD